MTRKLLRYFLAALSIFILTACQNGADPNEAKKPNGSQPTLFADRATTVNFSGDVLMVGVKKSGTIVAGTRGRFYTSTDPGRVRASFPDEPRTLSVASTGKWIFTNWGTNSIDITYMDEQDGVIKRIEFINPQSGQRMIPFGAFFWDNKIIGVYDRGYAVFDEYGSVEWNKLDLWEINAYPSAIAMRGEEIWTALTLNKGMPPPAPTRNGYFYIDRFNFLQKNKAGSFLYGSNEQNVWPLYPDEYRMVGVNSTYMVGLANNNKVAVWRRSDGKKIYYEEIDGDAQCIAIHPVDATLAIGTQSGDVVLFQITGTGVEELVRVEVGTRINFTAWSPDLGKLTAGTLNKAITYPYGTVK